jgi:hypothetical protein
MEPLPSEALFHRRHISIVGNHRDIDSLADLTRRILWELSAKLRAEFEGARRLRIAGAATTARAGRQ